jgi:hypothetical protein
MHQSVCEVFINPEQDRAQIGNYTKLMWMGKLFPIAGKSDEWIDQRYGSTTTTEVLMGSKKIKIQYYCSYIQFIDVFICCLFRLKIGFDI